MVMHVLVDHNYVVAGSGVSFCSRWSTRIDVIMNTNYYYMLLVMLIVGLSSSFMWTVVLFIGILTQCLVFVILTHILVYRMCGCGFWLPYVWMQVFVTIS